VGRKTPGEGQTPSEGPITLVHAEVDHKVAQITTDITHDYCKQRPLYFEEIHSVELSFCSYPHVVFDCNLEHGLWLVTLDQLIHWILTKFPGFDPG
jgi:hypothetical protein